MESGEPEASAARGAVCSAHPTVPAASTCVRCGDFLCEPCRTEGESVCAACRSRAFGPPFPLERSRFEIGAATSHAFTCFTKNFLPFLGAGSAAYLIPMIVQYALTFGLTFVATSAGAPPMVVGVALPLLITIPGMVLQAALYLGGFRLAIDALEGREPSFAGYFAAMARTPAALLQMLLLFAGFAAAAAPIAGLGYLAYLGGGEDAALVTAVLASFVLVVPIMWVWFGLLFGWLELAYDADCSALDALGRSWAIAKGHRLDVFLMGLVFVGASLVGFAMCCVGYLPALGFTFVLHATVYLGLRRGLLAAVERS